MTVGIRELKANLSRYLKKVRAGATLHVSDRGKTIATIQPVAAEPNLAWVHQMVAEGKAHWNGRKPGPFKPVKVKPGKLASEMVIEDRG